MRPVAEQREGANRNLDTLQALEPAHEEEQSTGAVSDLAASLGAVDRLEHREVDAGRDDEDSSRVGAVRRRDQQVRLPSDLALHDDAKLRFGASAVGQRPVFDQAERVRHVRPAGGQLRPDDACDLAGQPVVGEDEVVAHAFACRELQDAVRKCGDLVEEGVFVDAGTDGQIDDPRQSRQGLAVGVV